MVISHLHSCVYTVSGNAAEMIMQRMQTTDRIIINWATSLPTSTAMHRQPNAAPGSHATQHTGSILCMTQEFHRAGKPRKSERNTQRQHDPTLLHACDNWR